jgi:outer membrane receptor protein involved in Fe transport
MQKEVNKGLCFKMLLFLGLILSQVFGAPLNAYSINTQDIGKVVISISIKDASLATALSIIGTKCNYGITYNDEDLPKNVKVNYEASNVSAAHVLDHILKKTGLSYREFKSNIIVYTTPPKKNSDNGSIQGRLTDIETGEPLIGATIKVLETSLGTTTNTEGDFTMLNVPVGIYQLAFSYVGYETSILRDVKVTPGQVQRVDFKLKISNQHLQDIEIIGNRALSGNVVETNEVSLVNEIRTSSVIITGISAQQISRSVDQDAGEVARRLPGVTVQNNFVSIRGMQERYNLTFLNGMVAPSSEADRRAFSYDMLPSNMIDKMTVHRSPSPELLADFSGGIIKIETKNTSIARQFEVNVSTWYRPDSNLEKYNSYNGGKRDWMGKDDGTRALPNGFPATAAIPGGGLASPAYRRDNAAYTAEELAANAEWGKKLYNKWNLQKQNAGLDYRAGINYYDAWHMGKIRLSNLTSINTTQATQTIFQNFRPFLLAGPDGRQQDLESYKDTITQVTARWGILQNININFNPRHTIELKGLYNRLGIDETLVRDGSDFLSDIDSYLRRITYTYRSREILATQIAGSHLFGSTNSHSVKWTAGYNFANDDVPAQRTMLLIPNRFENNSNTNPAAPRYLTDGGANPFSTVNSLFYSKGKEVNATFSVDYEKKFERGFFLRAGFFNENKSKINDTRLIYVALGESEFEGNRFNEFNADLAFRPDVYSQDGAGAYIFDNEYLSGVFDIDGNINASYGAINIPLLNEKLNIYGGVRYEGQELKLIIPPSEYLTNVGYSPTLVDQYVDYWLPSVNVSWKFIQKMALRAAYGKTLNRPNYREIIPIVINDPRLNNQTVGNDSLKDATIQNFDLRWEYYPSESEFISIGIFYKELNNAIEPYVYFANREEIRYANTPQAKVYGIEAEVRKNLEFLPWAGARRFSIISNIAFLKSEVEFKDGLVPNITNDFNEFRVAKRPLEGTAEYVVNAGLYFEQENWGTKLAALYNILGQRLIYAGSYLFPETYELPRHTLDLTLRQRISKYIEVKAGIQDVLNQPRRLYRDYDRNQYWDDNVRTKLPNKDWMFQKFKTGSYYTIGLNFTF